MLTLAEVLELPVVRRGLPEVVVGETLLGRELRWAHVIEMPDPDDLLKGGELVLTTGLGAGTRPEGQRAWIASVLSQGAAAVAVELGTTWREQVPVPVVSVCSAAGVPLVAFRRAVRFVEITEAVHAAVLHRQFELLRRGEEIHKRFTDLILQGRGVPEIMGELAQAVGRPVVLEDAGGEAPEGAEIVEVRLMDSSWGRLMALAIDAALDDFDRVAVERAALAVAIDLLGQQHEEHLRARSRGAFLSDLADDRVEEADARRRAEALGFGFGRPGRGELLPVAAARRRPAGAARTRRARVRRGARRARRRALPRRARAARPRPGRRGSGDRRA